MSDCGHIAHIFVLLLPLSVILRKLAKAGRTEALCGATLTRYGLLYTRYIPTSIKGLVMNRLAALNSEELPA
jgi:hypothetical protein